MKERGPGRRGSHVTIRDIFPELIKETLEPAKFEPRTPCWMWQGATSGNGYGRVVYKGKKWSTHRLSYFIVHERLTTDFVCHSCDNPGCCNPHHLFSGTARVNNRDKIKWQAVPTDAEIAAIRASRMSDSVLARKYRLLADQVAFIRRHSRRPTPAAVAVAWADLDVGRAVSPRA